MLDSRAFPKAFLAMLNCSTFLLSLRKIISVDNYHPSVCVCVYHFSLLKIHSDDLNSENKHSHICFKEFLETKSIYDY